jgi:hypothetical protein
MGNIKTSDVLGNGLSFARVLFIVFLVLKLTGNTIVASWSWWWVTSPLWIGFALIIGIWLLFILFCLITLLINYIR